MERFELERSLDHKIGNIRIVRVAREGGFTVATSTGIEAYKLIIPEKGGIRYDFAEGEAMRVDGSGALLIPPKTPYVATYTGDGATVTVLTFDMRISASYTWLKRPTALRLDEKRSELLCGIVNDPHPLLLAAKIYEALYLLRSQQGISSSLSENQKKLLPAIEHINRYYYEHRRIDFYAGLCYLSESHFRRLFDEAMGASPIEYRNRLRIYEADKMIKSGEYTVSEAAYKVGFNNMSFFYRMYNRYIRARLA